MSKRSKKRKMTAAQRNVIARKKANEVKNEFFRKLYATTDALGIPNLIRLLPEKKRLKLFRSRVKSPRVKAIGLRKLCKRDVRYFQELVDHMLDKETHKDADSGLEFTMREFYTDFSSLYIWLDQLKRKDNQDYRIISQVYEPFLAFYHRNEQSDKDFQQHLQIISYYLSDPGKQSICAKLNIRMVEAREPYLLNVVEISFSRCAPLRLKHQGQARIGFPLQFIGEDESPLTIRSSAITGKVKSSDIDLPVYFQNHALIRLQERVDCIDKNMLYMMMVTNFADPKVKYPRGNRALVAFEVGGFRLGYFAVQLLKDKVLIKTFLFITADGTPEGNRLKRFLGICKTDKQYLCLDKSSAFLNPAALNDPTLKRAFKKAGCHHLFRLHERSTLFGLSDRAAKPRLPDLQTIRNYLQLGKVA